MFKNKAFYICSFLHNYNKTIPSDISKIILNFIQDQKTEWQFNNKTKINQTIKSLKKSYILKPYISTRYHAYNKFLYINLIKKSIKQNYIHHKRPIVY